MIAHPTPLSTDEDIGFEPTHLTDRITTDVAPIRCEDVTKRYGAVRALEMVDFTATPGHIHCIAGPNGSGKTTLGRLVAGLTRPTAGTVEAPFDEIGLGFQEPRFYPRLSVRENLAVFGETVGVSPTSPWARELVSLLRLDRVAHQPAAELSGGFKKKLDLAVTLLDAPTYLWLDEPVGELDDTSTRRVQQLLDAYVAVGGGVIVSTHDLTTFEGLATELSVFVDGRKLSTESVQAEDSLGEIVDRIYANGATAMDRTERTSASQE